MRSGLKEGDPGMDDNEKRELAIGRALVILSLLRRVAVRFLICSAVALVILLIIRRPLWWAPVAGIAAALVWTVLAGLLHRLLIAFGRWGGGAE